MKTCIKLLIACSLLISAGVIVAETTGYGEYHPITPVAITSHETNDIVFAGSDYTVTCTTSKDWDCNVISQSSVWDTVIHSWSGSGTFSPATGISVVWTTPTALGDTWITVRANDGPNYLANDPAREDKVSIKVQDIIYVDKGASAENDGTSWEDAFTSLANAVSVVNDSSYNGFEIWVANATYSSHLDIAKSVSIYGGFTGGETDPNQRDVKNNRATLTGGFDITANARVDGFIISGNDVNNTSCSPIIASCKFNGCGMTNNSSSPEVVSCEFRQNSGRLNGGAMYNTNSNPNITNCLFYSNSVDDNGGAIYNTNSDPRIINCTFLKNSADYGGAVYNTNNSSPTITNCILWNDDANSSGDEIYNGSQSSSSVSYSDVQGGWGGTGNIDFYPFLNGEFVPELYWYRDSDCNCWRFDNLCIDAGNNNAPGDDIADLDFDENTTEQIPFDIARKARIVAASGLSRRSETIDMGAYENHRLYCAGSVGYVDCDANGLNDGSSWTNAYTDLQDALDNTYCGGLIVVAQGTYKPGSSRGSSFHWGPQLPNKVVGGYAGDGEPNPHAWDPDTYETILSGDIGTVGDANDNCYHVLTLDQNDSDPYIIIDGFTITGGNANGSDSNGFGGGMYIPDHFRTLIIEHCKFRENSADYGGAIYNKALNPLKLENCVIWCNTATVSKHTIYNDPNSSSTIGNSNIEDSNGSGPNWDTSLGYDYGGNIDEDPNWCS